MTLGVMLPDVRELRRLSECFDVPVQIADPPTEPHQRLNQSGIGSKRYVLVNGRISAANIANVALEVLDIDRIETNDGRVETDVGLCDAVAVVVGTWILGEVFFDAVEGFEELRDGFFVGFLGAVMLISIREKVSM